MIASASRVVHGRHCSIACNVAAVPHGTVKVHAPFPSHRDRGDLRSLTTSNLTAPHPFVCIADMSNTAMVLFIAMAWFNRANLAVVEESQLRNE